MPKIFLIRHGQASFGASDYDILSETGVRQAEITAAALAARGIRPSRIVSGTLRRQRETAASFAAAGLDPTVDRRWDEYDADAVLTHHSDSGVRLEGAAFEVEGTTTNRSFHAALEPALARWIAAGEESAADRGWPAFRAAGSAALAELGAELPRGESAVVITSGGVIAALVGGLLGAAERAFAALNRVQVNAGITTLAHGSSGTNLITFNEHVQLEAVDPALVTYR